MAEVSERFKRRAEELDEAYFATWEGDDRDAETAAWQEFEYHVALEPSSEYAHPAEVGARELVNIVKSDGRMKQEFEGLAVLDQAKIVEKFIAFVEGLQS